MIAQEGIDVQRAADYQKVLDSRWRFMEVAYEIDVTITIPAFSSPVSAIQRIEIMQHTLGFTPAFHGSYLPVEAYDPGFDPEFIGAGLYTNGSMLYFRRQADPGTPLAARTIRVKAVVYNLPILEAYDAPAEATSNVGRVESNIGVRALDGSDSAVNIGDSSSHGFSVDTKKKILSINKVTTKWINSWVFDDGKITSIDTATNICTFTEGDPGGGFASNTGTEWIQTGVGLNISPADFATMPGPLTQGVTYYVIRLSNSTFKLALSEANAKAGIEIDLTSAGSLPAFIRRSGTADDTRIRHGAAYPPSFFFCEVMDEADFGRSVQTLRHISTTPLITADTNYLYFNGVQAVYARLLAIIIMKDPMELAQ